MRYNVWVEPIILEGNGVPFSPRTAYAVKDSITFDEEGGSPISNALPLGGSVYWSRRVANKVAAEKAKVMPEILRVTLKEMSDRPAKSGFLKV